MTRPERDVMVCRDCCCGTERKHPTTAHDEQVATLHRQSGPSARVRVVECLDECERSNVVLVRDLTRARDRGRARGRGGRDTWFGGVLDDDATTRLATWVRDGGALPAELARLVFTRSAP